jgi:hypothetical protein
MAGRLPSSKSRRRTDLLFSDTETPNKMYYALPVYTVVPALFFFCVHDLIRTFRMSGVPCRVDQNLNISQTTITIS